MCLYLCDGFIWKLIVFNDKFISYTDGFRQKYRLEIPYIDATFVGTGDLFAASLLAWMHKDSDLKVCG